MVISTLRGVGGAGCTAGSGCGSVIMLTCMTLACAEFRAGW